MLTHIAGDLPMMASGRLRAAAYFSAIFAPRLLSRATHASTYEAQDSRQLSADSAPRLPQQP